MTDKHWEKIGNDVVFYAMNSKPIPMQVSESLIDAEWSPELKDRNAARKILIDQAKKNGWRK